MNALIFFSSFIDSDTLTQGTCRYRSLMVIPMTSFFANLDFEYHTA